MEALLHIKICVHLQMSFVTRNVNSRTLIVLVSDKRVNSCEPRQDFHPLSRFQCVEHCLGVGAKLRNIAHTIFVVLDILFKETSAVEQLFVTIADLRNLSGTKIAFFTKFFMRKRVLEM